LRRLLGDSTLATKKTKKNQKTNATKFLPNRKTKKSLVKLGNEASEQLPSHSKSSIKENQTTKTKENIATNESSSELGNSVGYGNGEITVGQSVDSPLATKENQKNQTKLKKEERASCY